MVENNFLGNFFYLETFIPFICQSFLAVPSVKLTTFVSKGNASNIRLTSACPLSGKKKCSPGVIPIAPFRVYDTPFSSTNLAFGLTCIQYLGV